MEAVETKLEEEGGGGGGARWLFTAAVGLNVALRAGLVAWGAWQDETMEVKYTDVDYAVVVDGAELAWSGKSPYERTTYRYSPLLAWALTPAVFWFPSFGKWLFIAFDVATAFLLGELARDTRQRKDKSGTGHARLMTLAWLWNPLPIGISTRGSSDALVCFMVVAFLWLLVRGREHTSSSSSSSSSTANVVPLGILELVASAAFHGLSVHWRLYPIIFAPTILVALGDARGLAFGFVSALVFALLGLGSWAVYGALFLQETFLYHLTRSDFKHNFAAWFLALYLGVGKQDRWMSLAAFAPQVVVQLAIVARFARRDVVACACFQTMAFVAFNKVVTAQYFVWFACLLPLALRRLNASAAQVVLAGVVPWLVAEAHWLYWGYRVEFLGQEDFVGVWLAGLAFFVVSVGGLVALMRAHELDTEHW